jgi:hypothetical protein
MHVKLFEDFINEALTSKKPNEIETVEVDMSYDDDEKKDVQAAWKKFNLKVKVVKGGQGTEHEVTGKKKDILAYLQSEYFQMDRDDIEEFYAELLEGNSEETAEIQLLKFAVNENASTPEELASFISQNTKHFASFLKPKTISATVNGNIVKIEPGSKSFTITVNYDKKTIDTTGKPAYPESVSYVEIMEYVKTTKFKLLNESKFNDALNESVYPKSKGGAIDGFGKAEEVGRLDLKHKGDTIGTLLVWTKPEYGMGSNSYDESKWEVGASYTVYPIGAGSRFSDGSTGTGVWSLGKTMSKEDAIKAGKEFMKSIKMS